MAFLFFESILSKDFFERDPEIVAKELLGKKLIRKLDKTFLKGIIVETEAYFGFDDPASRAYKGKKTFNKLMWSEPGKVFIYNVHKYWMFNIVAHERGIGAVLIRAIEPTIGIEVMKTHRSVKKDVDLTNGPGKLTLALKIDKSLNGIFVTSHESEIIIIKNMMDFKIGKSHRIGVTKDLEKKLRFFIKGNRFVSR